jgi:hypothetical protein
LPVWRFQSSMLSILPLTTVCASRLIARQLTLTE